MKLQKIQVFRIIFCYIYIVNLSSMIRGHDLYWYRVKFTPNEIAEEYDTNEEIIIENIKHSLNYGNKCLTLESDVSKWFPLNYSEIWEC